MNDIGRRVDELYQQGVILTVENNHLRIKAPREILVPELVNELKTYKQDLIEYLQAKSSITLSRLSPDLRVGGLPLSYAQERLWFLDQLDGASALYNIPLGLGLYGTLNEVVLERALQEVVARHEALRTQIVLGKEGQPEQYITQTSLELSRESLRGSKESCDASLRALAVKEASTAFELAADLKIRALLVKVSPTGEDVFHALLITMHHIASDGWSADILVRELGDLYTVGCEGGESSLPELSIQYVDYAVWQRTWLDEARMGEQLAYWQQQLSSAPPLLELPTDRPRPPVVRFEGRNHEFTLSEKLTKQLRALGGECGATLYMTLLSAFNVLLSRYSGEEDIVVGSPIANRQQEEIESLIGFFVNTLVLRTEVSGDLSFTELLGLVRETTLSAYQHQDVPFEKLVEELQPARSLSYLPLFQVMFQLQNMPDSDMSLPGLSVDWLDEDEESAKFDLTLGFYESGEALSGWLNYNTDLFDESTIVRMAGHLEVLLEGIVLSPQTPVSRLPLLRESERQALLVGWNDTAAAYSDDQCLQDLFAAQVASTPDAIAVFTDEGQITFQELNAKANQLAHCLVSHGIEAGSLVGVCLERSIEMYVGILATLKSGGAYVPIDPAYPAERITLMLHDSAPGVVLTHSSVRSSLPASDALIIELDTAELSDLPSSELPIQATDPANQPLGARSVAYVIYTSGSSGRPKGVQGTHGGVLNRCRWMWETYPFAADEVACLKTAISFVDSVWEMFGPLLRGIPAQVISDADVRDPVQFVSILANRRISRLVVVPSLLTLLLDRLEETGETLPSLLLCSASGETLPADTARRFKALLPDTRLLNLYGSSEVAADVTYHEVLDAELETAVPIGKPIANSQVYVLDTHMQPVPVGVTGELYIGGANVALGYYEQPTLSAERFLADPYSTVPGARLFKTGDLARWLENGQLDYQGRNDSQVKVRGFRIELGEVESVLGGHSAVADAVVVLAGEEESRQLVAYFVSTDASQVSGALDDLAHERVTELRQYLIQRLPDYMVPSVFMQLDAMPLSPSGKVDRRALPAPDQSQLSGVEYVAPESETERALAGIWSELLDVEKVGVHDNFFTLGGHSLKAVQVVSRVRSQLSVEMPLKWLFESPTVGEMSVRIDASQTDVPASSGLPLEPVDRTGALTLSYAQERLWFLDEYEGASALYNLSLGLRLSGTLNKAVLESALQTIVMRHEVLRTKIISVKESVPLQQITDTKLKLLAETISGSTELCQTSLNALVNEQTSESFDLSADLKIRALLVKICPVDDDEYHALIVTMHHIASDGWSSDVFISELSALYSAGCEGSSITLPPLPIQYVDYAVWQRAWLDEARMGEQLDYWQAQLAGVPPLLELPTDRPRPAVQRFEGRSHDFTLPASLTRRLHKLSNKRGATLYMTLLSAFTVLLSRYSGEEDIVVGSPIANRQQEKVEPLIGFFVNTLVLRTDVSSDLKFTEHLDRVRDTTLSAYQYQDVPFEKLVEELQPARSLSYSPLFQVLFQLQNMPDSDISLPGLHVDWLDDDEESAKFDLTMGLYESDDELSGWLNYNTDLYDESTIQRMVGHFEVLLEGIVANPQTLVSHLPLMEETERQALLLENNQSTSAYPSTKTMVDLFAEQAALTPNAIALEGQAGRHLDYATLDRDSNRLAHYLINSGAVGEGSSKRIGVYLERDVEMVVALLGVLKAGAAYVPMDPLFPPERLALMAEDAQLAVVLTQASLEESVPGTAVKTIVIDKLGEALSQSRDAPLANAGVYDTAYVIYTSGSTGRPKGVSVGHQALTNFLCSMQSEPGLVASDRLLAVTTLSFDIAALELYLPLITGACTILASREETMDPESLVRRLRGSSANVMQATPATWRMLLDSGWSGESGLKVLCGGEALPRELATELLGKNAELWNLYGPTETTIWSTLSRVEPGEGLVSVGRPIANTQVYVLDEGLAVQPVGVSGELYIGGDGVAQGYLDREELTAEKFVLDPFRGDGARMYRTGDRARLRVDGTLEVLGRLDEQVKLRGYRIEPGEIRARLLESEHISDAVVVVREEVQGESQLVAYLVGSSPGDLDEEIVMPLVPELRKQLQSNLPDYMIPSAWVELKSLPLTPNGKVDRRSLPAPDQSQLSYAEYVAPESETERALAGIWSEMLGVEQVGLNENFFTLGGHSLKAVQVVSRVRSQLSVEMPLKWLFESPTVGQMAYRMDADRSSVQASQALPLVPIVREGALALSYAQERLWFLDELEGASGLYNIPFALRLVGELNQAVLKMSLQKIVERHEVLRTRIVRGEGGEPEQQVTDTVLKIQSKTLNGSVETCTASLNMLVEKELSAEFDLSADLKIRALLVKVTPAEEDDYHALIVTMHHIASDGWSLDVFERELGELYSAGCENREAVLAPLSVQYADYAVWQQAWLDEARMGDQLAYWQKQMSGAPPLLELPSDRPRPAVQGFVGRTHSFMLSATLTKQLRALGNEQGATLYMTLLSAFNVLLSRYSGEEDIVVGSPIANRQQEEIESLIGFFVNTLVLRTEVSGDLSFTELLGLVRETTLSAYQHQDVPFEKLVEELQPARSLSYLPLFQVMFQLQNMPDSDMSLPGLSVDWLDEDEESAKFDLTLGFYESGEALSGWLNYNTDLFDESTIVRMAGHLEVLLEGIVLSPQTPVSRLPLLRESERQALLVGWNDTAAAYSDDQCLQDLFAAQVASTPDAIAVFTDEGQITFQELNAKANQLAHCLVSHDIKAGSLVGVCLERSIEMYVGILATLKSGAAYVPIDPGYPAERITLMLHDSAPGVVLTHSSVRSSLPASDALIIELDTAELSDLPSSEPPIQATDPSNQRLGAHSVAYVIYTSGSSGRPKGVQGTHGGVLNRCRWMWEAYPFAADEVACLKTAISFVDSVWEMFGPLLRGIPAQVISDADVRDPVQFVSILANRRISRLVVVPSLLTLLLDRLEETGETLPSLLLCSASGETLPADTARRFKALLPDTRLLNLYGSSEVAADVTYHEVLDAEVETAVPIGKPIANSQVYVLDTHMQPVPVGVTGELYIGGANVALGYYEQPTLSAERFLADPYSTVPGARLFKTGDLARWLENGQLDYQGRNDSQVKVRGFRIELGEVESVLGSHSAVADAVVVLAGEEESRQLVAYFVSTDASQVSGTLDDLAHERVTELRQYLIQRLPDYMVPSVFMQLDAMPLTPSGKVDRRSLPAPDQSQLSSAEYVAPESETEHALAEIWSELLDVEKVGVNDNFFTLGGHSLKAVQVVSRVRTQLSVEMPLKWLFETPNLGDLSARIVEHRSLIPTDYELPISSVVRVGSLGLSYAQERLWFLDQLEGASALYNIPFALRLEGELNQTLLEQALQQIVERHEVLRTRIVSGKRGEPEQQISNTRFTLPRETVRGTVGFCEAELERIAEEEAATVFVLSEDLKISARLVKVCEDDTKHYHVLLVTLHHIASDGWSLGVFEQELSELYTAGYEGRDASLPSLPVQYADFAIWQRAWLANGRMDDQLAYWSQKMSGAPPLLELPTDRPRPVVQRFDGSTHKFNLPSALTERLRALGNERGATLYMTLLSAFTVLLSRYSGEEDIVVGSPIANRQQEEIEPLIGFFVNTLVLRTDTSGDIGFTELLERVRETTLSAYQHQDVPFEKLVEELQPIRSLSYSPLFQVFFQLQNMPDSDLSVPGLNIDWIEDTEATAKFDLTLGLYESGEEELYGWFNYNTDLFDATTIARMADHFEVLLNGIVAEPKTLVSRLKLLSDSEQRQLLVEWNDTGLAYPQDTDSSEFQCIHHLFEAQVARAPDAIAVISGDTRITYSELNVKAEHLVQRLLENGVGAQSLVGICLDRSVEMYVGILATLKAGGAYVPIDPAYPADRIAMMLHDSTPTIVLTHADLRAKLPSIDAFVIELDCTQSEDLSNKQGDLQGLGEANQSLAAQSVAYVIYTSGSSGRPKGVQGTHGGVINRCRWMWETYPFAEGEVACLKTAISFVDSVWEIFGPLLSGVPALIIADAEVRDPERFVSVLQEQRISRLVVVPSLLTMLLDKLEDTGESMPALRLCSASGETLPTETARRFQSLLPDSQLLNLYGSSEVAADVTYYQVDDRGMGSSVPIGRPIANSQVYVLDNQMQPVPIGVTGELFIGGANVALGYYNQPALSAERFLTDPFSDKPMARLFKTGDLARWLPNGHLEFQGRNDTQVKIRGFRIELGEVESILGSHASISDAVVEMVGEGEARQLVAYYVSTESLSVSELREFVSGRLPDYMIPSLYMQLDELPLTPNGKLDRRSLPAPDASTQVSGIEYIPPESETEKAMVKIWSEMLGVEQIGLRDNFFALGGHSLMAMRLVSEIENKLGIKVPLVNLFQGATIESVISAQSDSQEINTTDHSICRLITRNGSFAPLFMAGTNPRYMNVAEQLHKSQPAYQLDAYALQANRIKNGQKTCKSIEQLAQAFIENIKEVQPVGPYNISGGCEGALIAVEIAIQLKRKGESVSQLVIWGTPAPGPDLQDAFEGSSIRRLWWQLQSILEKGSLRELGFRAYWELFKHEYIEYLLFFTMLRYMPSEIIDTDLHLVALDPMEGYEQFDDLTMGWGKYITGDVIIEKLPGNHDTWLRDYADVFGKYLEVRMKEHRDSHLKSEAESDN